MKIRWLGAGMLSENRILGHGDVEWINSGLVQGC